MSHENPTPLRVGATGTLNGWNVRVAGRVVLGMEDGGETYYWNEFNLVDRSGNSATLVFEETEDGAEWKVFRSFTPAHPLTAHDAATKRVGDMIDLDGTPTRITLVDQSRVYFIEGTAPEGVEVGDVANYFNVDTGSRMLVASWTDDEIEFYEGLDAPADSVADAFKLPRATTPGSSSHVTAALDESAPETSSGTSWFTKLVLPLLGVASLFGAYSCFSSRSSSSSSAPVAAKAPAPTLQLASGAQGTLAQRHYVIDGRALVEVARPNGRHDRREYQLRSDAGERALLINGLSGGSKEWHLLQAISVPPELTPESAAGRRKGATLAIEGKSFRLTDLFSAKIATTEGFAPPATQPGLVQYGFIATETGNWLMARWTEDQVQLYRGTAVPEADVLAALGRGAK